MSAPVLTTASGRELPRLVRVLGSIVVVVLVSFVAGALTPIGQEHLPRSINSVANSSGAWTLIAFAAVFASRARGWWAAALGAVSFILMNGAFAAELDWSGHPYGGPLQFWLAISIVVGPLVGAAASWLRSRNPLLLAAGAAAPSAVLMGEGAYMLVVIPGVSTAYAVASVLVGALLVLGLALLRIRSLAVGAISVGLALVGATAFFMTYQLIPVLLGIVP